MPNLIAGPAAAWRAGQAAAGRGDLGAAVLWLERAVRLAPGDPRVLLDLAHVRLRVGGAVQWARAGEAFAGLAARYDIAAAWLGLLTVRRLLGDHAGAAAALGALLRRHCVPADPAFDQVAALVAADAGFDGWSGFRADGSARVAGAGALGPPFDEAALARVEGVVSVIGGGLVGWACRPAAPAAPPALILLDAAGRRLVISFGKPLPVEEAAPFTPRHGFALPANLLRGFAAPFRVVGPGDADIFGSPADPASLAAIRPVSAEFRGPPVTVLPSRAPLAVVMPVYRDLAATQAALGALRAALPSGAPSDAHTGARIIIVDDATPEPALAAWLDELAESAGISVIRHARNLGFPAAVNSGLAAAPGHDILLLNSDTLVPPGACEALANAAYGAPDIGTATPFSNEATILSYPNPAGGNKMPDLAATAALQRLAAAANAGGVAEIPTAIGFCMFIRHDCLAAAGPLRADIFVQGYGEENDFCLRARHAGYRHVAALGAYVAHRGGASFRAAGRALNARNATILNRLHPGYDALIAAHIAADPLRGARARFDAARFTAGRAAAGAALLISHDHGGGVARVIAAEMRAIRATGRRPLLLVPASPADAETTPFPWPAELTDDRPGDYPNLQFDLPGGMPDLLALLAVQDVRDVTLHHALGHHPAVRGIAAALGVEQNFVIHDYASFCPRVTLLVKPAPAAEPPKSARAAEPLKSSVAAPRYCGEPNLAGCTACFETLGDETFENLPPAALVARSAAEFAAAARITAPSADAARRIARHFPGIRPQITPWEDDTIPVSLTVPRDNPRRIVVVGGIGPSKGFDILLACARDALQRRLKLEFFIAGRSSDDDTLLAVGNIFITGPYQEGEATELIKSLNPDLAFLPSIWPETWCFALSEAWRAGLHTLAFDLGAQAARIRATNRGAVLPLGLPVPRINDALLNWRPG